MVTFQQLVLRLQDYWGERGCAILQPYDMPRKTVVFDDLADAARQLISAQ